LEQPVVVVLEGAARRGVPEGVGDGVTVVHADGSGDAAIISVTRAAATPVVLVSADRELRRRVRDLGGDAVSPAWLLDRLGDS
jgi:hypothetical protein